jgi:glucokinase
VTLYVGVDVGGTKCAVVLIDDTGTTLGRSWHEHDVGRASVLTDVVADATGELLTAHSLEAQDVARLGVAAAGLVSRDRATLVRGPTLDAIKLDLGPRLAARIGRPVTVVNDANAALFGHVRLTQPTDEAPGIDAAGQGTKVWLLLALGTGIGGAVMVGDTLVIGEHGFAAELGHVPVDFDDAHRCLCRATGCVEQFASGRGIAERAALAPPPPESSDRLRAMGATEPYTSRHVVAAAAAGDAWAAGLLAHAGQMLGRAVATLCVVLDPDRVIIAGSFGHAAGEWLLPHAQDELQARWPYARERPVPMLSRNVIGPYVAATGAALLAKAEQENRGSP